MSATLELIAEQIRLLNEKIDVAAARGEDVSNAAQQLSELNSRFAMASMALNENKAVLKG